MICYLDRVNISVAIIPMAEQFDWTDSERGLVLSSFFVGYMATQVMGGSLAARFGGKVFLGFGSDIFGLDENAGVPAQLDPSMLASRR